jgi:hypothetical protein
MFEAAKVERLLKLTMMSVLKDGPKLQEKSGRKRKQEM